MSLVRRSFVAVSLLCASASPAVAEEVAGHVEADEAPSLLPFRLDTHASLDWEGAFGVGARADIPIFDKAKLSNSRDELAISVGADVMFVNFSGSDRITVWPTVTLQWSLGVSESFVFYPELGIAGEIQTDRWAGFYPNVGFGGRYHLYRSLALLGRVGWPMALNAGLTF